VTGRKLHPFGIKGISRRGRRVHREEALEGADGVTVMSFSLARPGTGRITRKNTAQVNTIHLRATLFTLP